MIVDEGPEGRDITGDGTVLIHRTKRRDAPVVGHELSQLTVDACSYTSSPSAVGGVRGCGVGRTAAAGARLEPHP